MLTCIWMLSAEGGVIWSCVCKMCKFYKMSLNHSCQHVFWFKQFHCHSSICQPFYTEVNICILRWNFFWKLQVAMPQEIVPCQGATWECSSRSRTTEDNRYYESPSLCFPVLYDFTFILLNCHKTKFFPRGLIAHNWSVYRCLIHRGYI